MSVFTAAAPTPTPVPITLASRSLERGKPHTADIVSIFSLNDPNRVMAVDSGGTVQTWNVKSGEPSRVCELGGAVDSAAISSDENRIAIRDKSVVKIFSTGTCNKEFELTRLRIEAQSMSFAPAGDTLLLGGGDAKIYRWKFVQEAETDSIELRDKAFERYNGPAAVISSVVYHPFGRVFFTSDWDGGLDAWLSYDSDPFGGDYDFNLFGPRFFSDTVLRRRGERGVKPSPLDKLAITRDGTVVMGAARNGMLELWQVRGLVKGVEIQAHKGVIYDAAVDGEHSLTAAAGRDGRVTIWKFRKMTDEELKGVVDPTATWELKLLKEVSLPDARAIAFSGSGMLVAGEKGGRVLTIEAHS